MMRALRCCLSLCLATSACCATPDVAARPQSPQPVVRAAPLITAELPNDKAVAGALQEHYTKYEYRIPMRDGARLYTCGYVPKDRSKTYPILLLRTPYSVMPYGVDNYPDPSRPRSVKRVAPSRHFVRQGYILVHQDVRGRLMSEGTFVNVRPRNPGGVDETTDAWDTIDWLVKNVPANSGKVGVWGISYPGFYAAQAAVDAHPALKAVSPQAPVTDWFASDDFHHNGAFMVGDTFPFFANFGKPRPEPTKRARWDFEYEVGGAYEFFLRLGPLSNVNAQHLHGKIPFWNQIMAHGTRDAFWKARDPRPHYRNVKPAVMTVGGWFDAENLFGALATYRAFESQSPGANNTLVMGPWRHGGWGRDDGDRHGDVLFGAKTSLFYREHMELAFFDQHLAGQGGAPLPEAWMFETGTNIWQRYDRWPPQGARSVVLHLRAGGTLSTTAPTDASGFEQYRSDPDKPVPYRGKPSRRIDSNYMSGDQRFAARRPDVLVYATEPLPHDVTLTGPVEASLWVSTTGTDADFVVKLVDVYPPDHADPKPNPAGVRLGGYQQLVRGEIMRGKFRNSLETPEAFEPGKPTPVRFALPDVCHSFRPGHRIMVQVQSSWFPLADRNPQVFTDIYRAKASDFQAATHRVYRTAQMPSGLKITLAPKSPLPDPQP